MNEYVKLPQDGLLEAGRFDPDCAETSWTLPTRWYTDPVSEDLALCEAVQRGLPSRVYRQGKLIVDRDLPEFSEHHVHFFQQFVYRALREEPADEPRRKSA